MHETQSNIDQMLFGAHYKFETCASKLNRSISSYRAKYQKNPNHNPSRKSQKKKTKIRPPHKKQKTKKKMTQNLHQTALILITRQLKYKARRPKNQIQQMMIKKSTKNPNLWRSNCKKNSKTKKTTLQATQKMSRLAATSRRRKPTVRKIPMSQMKVRRTKRNRRRPRV